MNCQKKIQTYICMSYKLVERENTHLKEIREGYMKCFKRRKWKGEKNDIIVL